MRAYSIQGGDEGSKRLDILCRTLEKSTGAFLANANLNKVERALDLGCGNGKVTAVLAEKMSDNGQVLGVDISKQNIEIATHYAKTKAIQNMAFETLDAYKLNSKNAYDLIYSRFLLSHLPHPEMVLAKVLSALKQGGRLLIEETDFSGHFCYPKSTYFDQYVGLYQALLKKRGADANLGQRMIKLLQDNGFKVVQLQIAQPVHSTEEGKLMAEITFKGIAQALLQEGLLTEEKFMSIYAALVEFRKRQDTIMSLPRIFQIEACSA